jgi:hypothetical protein
MSHFRHWGIAFTKKVGITRVIFSPMVILGSVKEGAKDKDGRIDAY